MSNNKVIYIKDTLCGWCRVSSPVIEDVIKLTKENNIDFSFYHRRLFVDDHIPAMSENFIQMVEGVGKVQGPKMTGLAFSDKYFNLVKSKEFSHESNLTSIGDAAAKLLAKDEVKSYAYAKKLQDLVFDDGLNPNDLATIKAAAEGLFDAEEFEKQLDKAETVEYSKEQSNIAVDLSSKLHARGVPALFFYNASEDKYTALDAYSSANTIEFIKELNSK